MSKVVLALLALTAVVQSPGQSPDRPAGTSKCSLTVANSPAIRGVRLGMTVEQLLALFPGSAEKEVVKSALASANGYPYFGVARLFFAPVQYGPPAGERFAGVDGVTATLLDGRVVEVTVQYSAPSASGAGVSWRETGEFVAKLSAAFHLPPASDWQAGSTSVLNCDGFEIAASGENGGRVTLKDGSYIEKVKERRAADEERRRRAFRP